MVGIGASAGGLDAFSRLMANLPADTGLAYLLIQHLDPTHESALVEILSRVAHIPVATATDRLRVDANHAYVIPPNTTMTVTGGHLRLTARGKARGPHLAVDAFLCSLAEVDGSGAVGIILSGAGSDGARGIEAIKGAGGITMAQDAATAAHQSMPEAAVATGCVDFVLPPEEIAQQLARLGKHIAAHGWDASATEVAAADEEEELRQIFVLLKNHTGVDFQHYRRGTVHRRILRRMLVHQRETRSDYIAYLRRNPAELDFLYDDLLIGVTSFFRDPEVFATLQSAGFPEIMQGHTPGTPVRIWVAGCSGGEEAYSLAIALLEFLGDAASEVPIQLFGTDLNEHAVTRARHGLYSESIARDVSAERLHRFFVPEDGGYRIAKTVRDLCVFSRQNLVSDPPFSHIDLISCRNVLIYLEPVLQSRLFPLFHYALEPNGLLLLGAAESARSASEFFVPLTKRHKIYRRHAVARRSLDLDFLSQGKPARGVSPAMRRSPLAARSLAPPPLDHVERDADHLVLHRFAPPGVVINEQMEILQFRGSTAPFLEHPAGTATLQLLKLVRPELVMPLRAAIHTASSERCPVRQEQIALDGDLGGHEARSDAETAGAAAGRSVAIEVLPYQPAFTTAQYFVVLFEEQHASERVPPSSPETPREDAAETSHIPADRHPRPRPRAEVRRIAALRDELTATKRYLQAIVEEYEGANEELRAANEEIQSANEELQSTNEELETTKEEVQSTNEELNTVNEELRHRNRELHALSGDLSNVLAGTTIPMIIVGRDLRLRRFTPAADRVMRVIPTDTGRPLSDVRLLVSLPDLEQHLARTIETLEISRHEVQSEDGTWWELTIRPYLSVDRRVDGATLVFTDIDATKRYGVMADAARQTEQHLREVADTARREATTGREMAEAANMAKGAFLANISHDLRTPLNAITGYTELLAMGLRGPVTSEQLEDMARIKRSARHLLALVNDILNFAKVEAGRLDLRMANVPIVPLAVEMEELVAPQLKAKSLSFDGPACDAAAQKGIVAHADPEKLRQILLNLLTNAIKFTAPGGRIGIDCAATGSDDGQDGGVQVSVWDTGSGIAATQLEHIFEPFLQIDRGLTTPPPEGVGLGLAISRDLARAMGGDVTVESTVGSGSRFTVTLRRGSTDAESAPHAEL